MKKQKSIRETLSEEERGKLQRLIRIMQSMTFEELESLLQKMIKERRS